MAAAALSFSDLANFVECQVCMDTFVNPKQLACHHLFCKECIDDILLFDADGEATVTCANRCAQQTVIPATQTSNDLGTSYQLKGILDMLKGKRQITDVEKCVCCHTDNCTKEVMVYCCGVFLCRPCLIQHEASKQHHEMKTEIVFDKDNKVNVLCKEHATKCTHLCADNEFLCVYCLNRVHKPHIKYTVEAQAGMIKEALTNDQVRTEHIKQLRNAAEETLLQGKAHLHCSLQERKLSCLSAYLAFLNEEEAKIKEQYQNVSNEHLRRYPATVPTDYYRDNLKKNSIQVTIEKRAIVEKLSTGNAPRSSIQPVNISLSNDFDMRGIHPLGELQASYDDEILFSDTTGPTLTYTAKEVENCQKISSELTVEMDKILQVVHVKNENIINTSGIADGSKENLSKQKSTGNVSVHLDQPASTGMSLSLDQPADVRKRTNQPKEHNLTGESDTEVGEISENHKEVLNECIKLLDEKRIGYIEELIEGKSNKKLKLLLDERCDIVNLNGDLLFSYRPLYYAARYNNLEALKLLVQYGSRVDAKCFIGGTALHTAVRYNSTECVAWLAQQHSMLVDMKGFNDCTPLHDGVRVGYPTCVEILVEHGADIHAKDRDGLTPLQFAKRLNQHECANQLKKYCKCKLCK